MGTLSRHPRQRHRVVAPPLLNGLSIHSNPELPWHGSWLSSSCCTHCPLACSCARDWAGLGCDTWRLKVGGESQQLARYDTVLALNTTFVSYGVVRLRGMFHAFYHQEVLPATQNAHHSKCPPLKMSATQNTRHSKYPPLKMPTTQNARHSHSKCLPLKMPATQNACHFHSKCLPLKMPATQNACHSKCLPLKMPATQNARHSKCLPLKCLLLCPPLEYAPHLLDFDASLI